MKSPYFELSKSIVLEKYKEVEQIADIVSYSSKTNSLVTEILEENTNSLFSIHFVNELKHVKDASRVFFLAQAWSIQDIDELLEKGVKRFAVDNEADLDLFINHIKIKDVSVELFLRLKLKENTIRTEKYFVFGMGADIINKRIKEISQDKELKSKISLLGLHFHRKTQNIAEWKLKYEIEEIITPESFKALSVINIGGGLPAHYANTNKDAMSSITRHIGEFKTFLHEKKIKLMIEPGRFISAPAVKLITTIKQIHDNNIIVDASVYNTDMDALIVPVKLLVQGELEKGKGKAFVIKGITPCSLDLFRYRVYLENPKVGDEIVFENAGAYNFTTDFCDLDEIETVQSEKSSSVHLKKSKGDKMKIISIPFSGGGLGHGNGANEAPKVIIEQLKECFANEDGFEPKFSFDELDLDEKHIQNSHDKIKEYISSVNEKAILLGGDHSITCPAVQGFAKNNSDFCFVVFDAHPDMMDDFRPPTQEDYLRVLIEDGTLKPEQIILVGTRNWDKQEVDYLKDKNILTYSMKDIFDKGIKEIMKEICSKIDKPVYLSLDIDVVDPVEAIGTGYIEHGGMSSRELIYSLQELKKTEKIAMVDIVEVNPRKDVKNMTSKLAAKAVMELSDI